MALHLTLIECRSGRPKQFVIDSEQRLTATSEMATATQPHGVKARCPIKSFGQWRSPVHNNGVALLVRYSDAADMKALSFWIFFCGLSINPTKNQGTLTEFELVQAHAHSLPHHITLITILIRATLTIHDTLSHCLGNGASALQAQVSVVYIGLLKFELGVICHAVSCMSRSGSGDR
ncbi:unannotated protein [freshwater metagenome]|uniref:Unannotated protein n=1 Tax=freshwater metagenome TaxID=449393 RepID=A0A6J6ZU52_9ZZZZ